MAYKEHKVKQGECIASIAFQNGLFPDTVWNDPKNATLKTERVDPYVLEPGDVVWVKEIEGFQKSCEAKQRHRFRRKGVPEKLDLEFDRNGEPRANEAYELNVDGQVTGGRTDDEGRITAFIKPTAKKAVLTFVESGEKVRFDLGYLEPITEVAGVQARLKNLGYFDGPVDGKESEELDDAVYEFQLALDPTTEPTELNDAVRDKIKKAYGD